MKRLLLGIGLACSFAAIQGCCCFDGCGWSPCPWPGCGWDSGCGYGGGCGGCGSGCNRPGGCGDIYWGDWCTGNPHCSTCDGCGNWVGPPSPGGGGMPPEVYGHNGPYGQQVARNMPSRPSQSQMVRNVPPRQYGPQMARRTNQRVYGGRMGPPMGPQMSSQMAPQMAQRGGVQEYEGAIQYLGTTDKLVKPATLPGRPAASPSNVARRGQPTLAEPPSSEDQESEPREVRRASSRQYTR